MKKKLCAILWLACLTLTAAKYPPNQRWREINRGPFTVIFPADRWQEAEAALTGAKNAYEKLAAFWHSQPRNRIRIVLDDSSDQANGFATFFPFNLVGVNLSEPPPDSQLAVNRSWIDLVLAHELTHIFNLNEAAGPFLMLRRVFGSQPALYPAVQLPPWVIEGLAVYGESRCTEDGRLNHPPYALMLRAARRDSLFPDWRSLGGLPSAWPGPTAKYLFGAGFMQFLADQYGAASLRQYLLRATGRLVLLGSSRDFNKTFGAPLGKLWQEYKERFPAASGSAPEPLTRNGFANQYPCPLGESGLAYYHRDYRGRGAVEMLDVKSGKPMTLFKLDEVNSLRFAAKENKIFLSATEYYRAFSDFSDLYEFDMKRRRLKRLSHGLRLSQPVKKENSNEIFCVQRRDGRFFLALFDVLTGTAKTLSRGFTGLSQASLSPDQEHIAASVKPEGGPWGIGIFSKNGKMTEFVSLPGANLSQPRWIDDSRFCFIQADKESTRLASFSLADSSGGVCDDPRCHGLQQFAMGEECKSVYFTYFSGRGLEIARANLAGLPFTGQEFSVTSGIPETAAAAARITSRPYRFWRDLLPRWWSPALRMGGDEYQAGVMTGGQDALGIHSYSLEGYYGFASRRANFLFRYVYDGLFPTLSLSYRDETDDHGYFLSDPGTKAGVAVAAAHPQALATVRLRRPARGTALPNFRPWPLRISRQLQRLPPGVRLQFGPRILRLDLSVGRHTPHPPMLFPPGRTGQRVDQSKRPSRPAPLHSSLPARGAGLAPGPGQMLGSETSLLCPGGPRRRSLWRPGQQPSFRPAARISSRLPIWRPRLPVQPGISQAAVQDRKGDHAFFQLGPGLSERVFRHGPPHEPVLFAQDRLFRRHRSRAAPGLRRSRLHRHGLRRCPWLRGQRGFVDLSQNGKKFLAQIRSSRLRKRNSSPEDCSNDKSQTHPLPPSLAKRRGKNRKCIPSPHCGMASLDVS